MSNNIRPLPSDPRYSVSDDGIVYGIKGTPLAVQERHGYSFVHMSRACRNIRVGAHRLVLETFVGPCPDGMEALHANGVRSDNRLSNLRWGTRSENMQDALRHGTHPMASRTHCNSGHEFTEANTYWHPGRKAYGGRKACGPFRVCRECKRLRQIAYRRIRPRRRQKLTPEAQK